MPRETAAQRKNRISMLLAEYDARNRELRKLTKIVDGLKEQVAEIDPGTYGEWELALGTPREVTDQTEVKRKFAEIGEPLPTKLTSAPRIVRPKAAK